MLLCIFTVFCASPRKSKKVREMQSYADIKRSVYIGETDTLTLMSLIGPPQLVSKNARGEDVWSYKHKVFARDSKAYDLIFIFNTNDVLKDYTILRSEY